MEDTEDEEIEIPGARWSWLSPAILTTGLVGSILGDISEYFIDLSVCIASHSNWSRERKKFAEEAALEIERMTKDA